MPFSKLLPGGCRGFPKGPEGALGTGVGLRGPRGVRPSQGSAHGWPWLARVGHPAWSRGVGGRSRDSRGRGSAWSLEPRADPGVDSSPGRAEGQRGSAWPWVYALTGPGCKAWQQPEVPSSLWAFCTLLPLLFSVPGGECSTAKGRKELAHPAG